jgi:hypothetical protein
MFRIPRKYQIFVSSTYLDLRAYRGVVIQAIMNLGHSPAGMEVFPTGRPPWETIEESIRSSDYFVLLLGKCYGTIDQETKLGFTERELNYAAAQGIPVIALVLDPAARWTGGADKDSTEVDRFRERLRKDFTPHYWRGKTSLMIEALAQIHCAIERSPATGWIAGWYLRVFTLSLSLPLASSFIWTLICIAFDWPHVLGQKGVPLEGLPAAVWGFITYAPIIASVLWLRWRSLGGSLSPFLVFLCYALGGAIGGLAFYNSGVRSCFEGGSFPEAGRELVIVTVWSVMTSGPAMLSLLLPPGRRIFDSAVVLRHTICSVGFCWVALTYLIFVARGAADHAAFVPLRGFAAHVALSVGAFFGLVFSMRQPVDHGPCLRADRDGLVAAAEDLLPPADEAADPCAAERRRRGDPKYAVPHFPKPNGATERPRGAS